MESISNFAGHIISNISITTMRLRNSVAEIRLSKGACRLARQQANGNKSVDPLYDAILVDEAQDLPDEFLRICYSLLPEPKRLVYAYDELQNLSNTTVSDPETLFGMDSQGSPKVLLDQEDSDVILQMCYRNSRPRTGDRPCTGFRDLSKTQSQ